VGMVVACSLVAYALIGAEDVGFFWYRIAFITGTLLGLSEAALRLAHKPDPAAASVGPARQRRWRASAHLPGSHALATRR
jgi:hypothetical protein